MKSNDKNLTSLGDPVCPTCGSYDCALHRRSDDGEEVYECLDCGEIVIIYKRGGSED